MEGLKSISENGAIGPELKPESGSDDLNVTVSHGPGQHQVVVPSDSTFGDLKSVITQKIGLKPETCKLFFRGKEKDDDDHLQTAGVKDSSKVLLLEEAEPVQQSPEKVETVVEKVETVVVSRGGEAVSIVRGEVDKLADQVAALQAVVDGGTKVDDKDFLYLSEMLMRQLLKLDGIEAEGEGRVQRKMEVRRVQSFVDMVDILKSRNANLDSNGNATAPVTTQLETSEPGLESVSNESIEPSSTDTYPSSNSTDTPAIPVPSSSHPHLPSPSKVTQDSESFD